MKQNTFLKPLKLVLISAISFILISSGSKNSLEDEWPNMEPIIGYWIPKCNKDLISLGEDVKIRALHIPDMTEVYDPPYGDLFVYVTELKVKDKSGKEPDLSCLKKNSEFGEVVQNGNYDPYESIQYIGEFTKNSFTTTSLGSSINSLPLSEKAKSLKLKFTSTKKGLTVEFEGKKYYFCKAEMMVNI